MQRFSIIISIFNTQKFVAKAIESAINQSYKNIEIICVDDCSEDKSADIAKEFAIKDSRIKILQNPQNLGAFATRNIGALSAKSEYLLFLDADDSLELNACEKIHNAITAFSNALGGQIDIVAFNYAKRQSDSSKNLISCTHKTRFFQSKILCYGLLKGALADILRYQIRHFYAPLTQNPCNIWI